MVSRWWLLMVDSYGVEGIVLMVALAVLFVSQVWQYAVIYTRIIRWCAPNSSKETFISVVVVLYDPDEYWLEEVLPMILTQQGAEFEVVVVDVSGDEFYNQRLNLLAEKNPQLVVSRIAINKNMRISDRVAFNVGIKAAHNENIVLTTTAAKPATQLWLASFKVAFERGASVVLGYSNMERMRGFDNRFMRVDIFSASVRWLSAAVHNKPYRGTIHNIGFSRSLYFAHGGFNGLNLSRGIEDLFVQYIADNTNTAVVNTPDGLVLRCAWGSAEWWLGERVADDYPKSFYTGQARRASWAELLVRAAFFAVVAATIIIMPVEIALTAIGLYLLRLLTVMLSMNSISKKLGEKGIVRHIPLYDLLAPLYELVIRLTRMLRPSSKWK